MRFYFSGETSGQIRGPTYDRLVQECPWRLQSCHKSYVKKAYEWLQRAVDLGCSKDIDFMLDSGAFTAWNQDQVFTLKELMPLYLDIQQRFAPYYRSMVFINLDVIAGSRAKEPTEEEIAQCLIASDVNFAELTKRMGDVILPVFHQGEPWQRLIDVCDQGRYVCISPRQTLNEATRVAWVRTVGAKLLNRNNITHGLATTGNTIIRANRWFSVDSATWVMAGAFGTILVALNGEIKALSISSQNNSRYTAGQHFLTLTDIEQQQLEAHFNHYGFQVQQLVEESEYRMAFNLVSLREWSKIVKDDKVHLSEGLFDDVG